MSEFDLGRLSFGAPAAERDIAQGLIHYFVESDTFALLQARKKTLVIGNRGAGKSALFKVLAERERAKHSLVLELAPGNYSYEILTQHMVPESKGSWAKQGAYAAAWKYLIYVLVMKELTHAVQALKFFAKIKVRRPRFPNRLPAVHMHASNFLLTVYTCSVMILLQNVYTKIQTNGVTPGHVGLINPKGARARRASWACHCSSGRTADKRRVRSKTRLAFPSATQHGGSGMACLIMGGIRKSPQSKVLSAN